MVKGSASRWGRTSRELARQVVQHAIDTEVLPGTVIESEPDVQARLGASRATVREALRLLNFLGAAASRYGPGGGVVTARPDETAVASSLAMVLQSRKADGRSLIEGEAALLQAAAALAASRVTPTDIEVLRAALDPVSDDTRAPATAWIARVHDAIGLAAHNPAVAVQLNALTRVVVAIDPGDTPASLTRLSKLYSAAIDALEAGDSASAIDALERAATTRLRALSRLGDGVLDRWLTWPEIDRALEQNRKPL